MAEGSIDFDRVKAGLQAKADTALRVDNRQNLIQTAGEFVGDFQSPDYTLDGVLQRGYLYSLTGRTGDGKTAVALCIALCVACGIACGGKEVERGRVIFLAGENADDVRARFIAAAEALNVRASAIEIHFVSGVVSLSSEADRIAKDVERIGGAALVIVDTAAAFFEGDEENSNVELGQYARRLRGLCDLQGRPTVIVNAHPTKSANRSNLVPRGGGSFLAEVDGNLTVWSDDNETTEMHWAGKFRGPGFEPMAFKLERRTSDRLRDSKGRHVPTVIATPLDETALATIGRRVRSDEDAILDMLLNHPSAGFADWCRRLGWQSESGSPHKSKIARIVERFADDGLVKKVRDRWTLTSSGRKEAERVCGV